MQPSDFNREKVRRRLRKKAAELWGFQESEMEGFDPVIDLLLGACAVEFEKISNEIFSSETRVLERLAHLLIPEVLTGPKPAHAILHVRAVEPAFQVRPEDQFLFEKEMVDPNDSAKMTTKPVYFSPASSFTLFDAEVVLQGVNNKIVQQTTPILKDELMQAQTGKSLPPSTLWLGISLNKNIKSIEGMSFFFDWKNDPDKANYYPLLPLSRWFLGEEQVQTVSGYKHHPENSEAEASNTIYSEYESGQRIEKHTIAVYENCFITIAGDAESLQTKKYPPEFEQIFMEDDLKKLKDDLLWIRVQLPHGLPAEAVAEVSCNINSFPVVNRKLVNSNRPFALNKNFNIVPLPTNGEDFLSVKRVFAGGSREYRAVPFRRINQQEPETYAVRKGGVGRFDRRNATEMVNYILEMMRDESVAFTALGGSNLSREIMQLGQDLSRIEQNIMRKSLLEDPMPFMLIKPKKPEDVWIEYWTTNGEFANKIVSGSNLKSVATSDFQKENLMILASSYGGRGALNDAEKLYAYKNALLTRGRIVTAEDIKSTCFAELGNKISGVTVKKGMAHDPLPHRGLQRTLDVQLKPSPGFDASEEEWKGLCKDLEAFLQQKSSAISLPVRVVLSNA